MRIAHVVVDRPFIPHLSSPINMWQRITHPYTPSIICLALFIAPYFSDFSMPILFPEFRRFATPLQHLLFSGLLAGLVLGGTATGLSVAESDPNRRQANIAFLSSSVARWVFGALLMCSWLLNVVQLPMAFAGLADSPEAARQSIKQLGGLAFIGHLYMISLPALLLILRLQGKKVLPIILITFCITFVSAFATSERLSLIECLVAFGVFVGLYQPQLIRISTAIFLGGVSIIFLALNFLLRAPVLPPSMLDQASAVLPKIAVGTLLTYYADTANKLYFDMFTHYYNTDYPDKFYLTTPQSFLARLEHGHEEEAGQASKKAYTLQQGRYVTLDFLHGRNVMMTNPGGPAQDFSDFGWFFAIVIFIKFFLLGWIYRGAKNFGPLCIACYPLFFVSALDYPRLNLLYEVRDVMPLVVACGVIPLTRSFYNRFGASESKVGGVCHVE